MVGGHGPISSDDGKTAISYMQSTGRSKVAAPPQDIRPQWRIGHATTTFAGTGAFLRCCTATYLLENHMDFSR
jgi:hypothetical protein